MATVPRLSRVQPAKTLVSNDRINMQVNDNSSAILHQTAQIAAVGDKVGDIYQKYENDKIETLSTAAEQKYKAWNDQELQNLKNYDGDPTKAYVEYEAKAKEKHAEILAENSDVSDRVKRHFTSRMDKVVGNEALAANKQRGMQQEVYDNNMFESSVKLKKDNLPVVAGYVSKDDPSSFGMFDQGLHDIRTTIVKRGLKKGTVTQMGDDEEGKGDHAYQDDDGNIVRVKLSDMAKQRIAKEQSEGVKNSIEVLLAGGQVDEAKMMREKYKNLIDPVAASKLAKKFTTTDNKGAAFDLITSLRGKTEDEKIAAIEKHPDLAVRSEALKIKDADDRRIQSLKERRAKVNYEGLASYILEKQSSNEPLYGIADLENDQNYKAMVDHLDSKGRQAIEQMIEAPKTSNEKALTNVHALFNGETDVDLSTVSTEQFHHDYLTGLSKTDRNKALKDFTKLKNPSSNEERSSVRDANKQIKEILIKAGHIDSDESYDEDLLKAQGKLRDHLSNRKTMPNTEQLAALAKGFAAEVIDNKTFRPESVYGKKPASVPPTGKSGQAPTAPTTINKNVTDLTTIFTPSQIADLKYEFQRQNGGKLPLKTDEAFINFAKAQKKG
jgi:hypothetical protein